MDDLNLENVRPFDRPMTAGPNDRFVGRDDMGNKVYETVAGKRYTVRPATQEESQTTRAKVENWADKGAPLPSWEQIIDTVEAMPGAVYDSAQSSLSADASLGELFGFAGASSAPGVVSRVGTALDPSVVSAMGATHKVPRYLKKEPKAPAPEEPEVFNDDGLLLPKTPPDPGDGFTDRPTIQFRDPIDEILAEMEIPKGGITGAQLLKELHDNPTVRTAQLKSQGVFDRIDPAKRYDDPKTGRNSREVDDLLGVEGYKVQAVPQNQYDSYQRQPVQDKEFNYVEYAINADKVEGPTFRANSQHYQDNTLAHVRLSERQGTDGNYVLIEELQSDLLQKGFQKPSPGNFDAATRAALHRMMGSYDIIPEAVDKVTYQDFKAIEATNFDLGAINNLAEKYGVSDPTELYGFQGFIYHLEGRVDNNVFDVVPPPIIKTEESVRLGIETAMAHAAQNGINRVVIPPFERIVEQRFQKGSAGYDKAMDPKSGFYQTYVTAVDKVLKNLKQEMGDEVEIGQADLPYKNSNYLDKASLHLDTLSNGQFAALRKILDGQTPFIQLTPQEKVLVSNFVSKVQQKLAPDFTFERYQQSYNSVPSATLHDALYDALKIQSLTDPAIEINFFNALKNDYDLTRPRFAEGGMVLDPVSQNPVPPGAKPEEVRDDVPIMASEGEYVIPANVVRYLGLDKIEKLVNQAKQGLAELEAQGRVGGDTSAPDEELPFSPEELQRVDAKQMPQMAEGGMVLAQRDNSVIDPATGLPLWLVQMQQQQLAPTAPAQPAPTPMPNQAFARTEVTPYTSSRDRQQGQTSPKTFTGTAQRVDDWTPAEFDKYANTRNGVGPALGRSALAMIPGAGLGARLRQRYLERNVPSSLEKMIKERKDFQGNDLDDAAITKLQGNLSKITSEPIRSGGAIGGVRALAEHSGLVKPRSSSSEPTRLRDVFGGNKSVSPRVSSDDKQGQGLVRRPDKTVEKGGRKTSTSSNSSIKTSEKKKK